jgi:sigma-B regulation protein RsbU (phosphoserine phosphatase)
MTPPEIDPRFTRLEEENKRLRRAVDELSIINEVASAVTSTWSLDEIVDSIVQKCVKHLNVEQGAVLLFGKQDEPDALRTMVRRVDSEVGTIPYRLGDQLNGWMLKNQQPLVIDDLAADERFRLSDDVDNNIRSLMCVPLRAKARMMGVLIVFNKRSGKPFTESNQRLLTIIAAQSAQVIETARLYEEEKSLQLMQQEMELARGIQANLLPKSHPSVPGYDIAGTSVSAANVGGDYYDFLPNEDRLIVCLGDVSGKGMPASLLMANMQATIRGQNLVSSSAAECMSRSNRLMFQSTDSAKFVTFFYGILDIEGRTLEYSNAGHNPPILFSKGQETRLETGGPVLGVLPDFPYQQASVELTPGDLLLIFSDGFSEAMNGRFEEFGEDQLARIANENRGDSAADLIEKMSQAVIAHTGDEPQTDDMTIVAVRVDA